MMANDKQAGRHPSGRGLAVLTAAVGRSGDGGLAAVRAELAAWRARRKRAFLVEVRDRAGQVVAKAGV